MYRPVDSRLVHANHCPISACRFGLSGTAVTSAGKSAYARTHEILRPTKTLRTDMAQPHDAVDENAMNDNDLGTSAWICLRAAPPGLAPPAHTYDDESLSSVKKCKPLLPRHTSL